MTTVFVLYLIANLTIPGGLEPTLPASVHTVAVFESEARCLHDKAMLESISPPTPNVKWECKAEPVIRD